MCIILITVSGGTLERGGGRVFETNVS